MTITFFYILSCSSPLENNSKSNPRLIIINKAAAVTPIRLQGIPEFIEAEYNFSDLFC